MKHTLKLASLALAVSLSACGDNTSTTTTTTDSNMESQSMATASPDQMVVADTGMSGMANAGMTDQDFVTRASSMNVAEINVHKAAQSHATTADVKAHAKHMLTDHQKMGDEMKALAERKNMTVSSDPPAEKTRMLDDLNTRKGKDWDMAYLDAQVNDHNEAISLFESGSASVKDADLKALIDKTLPTLRDHLQMVKDAQAKMTK
jgi:putative membrane protein